uniref:Uncharacterized protein n=1 Tax=Ananas comosus var. bracteatus TaxID=296719 RepID=A0A6V7P595_ANACO|nr:unnamed protein product [Ananas comosus var. bracteatus]
MPKIPIRPSSLLLRWLPGWRPPPRAQPPLRPPPRGYLPKLQPPPPPPPHPRQLGDSPASIVVLAHNKLGGCIPPSIGRMADTLNEIVLLDDGLAACVPPEVGLLRRG